MFEALVIGTLDDFTEAAFREWRNSVPLCMAPMGKLLNRPKEWTPVNAPSVTYDSIACGSWSSDTPMLLDGSATNALVEEMARISRIVVS